MLVAGGLFVRSLGRAAQQRGDVGRAQEKLEDLQDQLAQLEREFDEEVTQIEAAYQADSLKLERLSLRPLKKDITLEDTAVVWTPWQANRSGDVTPLYAWEQC